MAQSFRLRTLCTLETVSKERRNAIGFLRLVLACAVVVSHAVPIGLGYPDPLLAYSGIQVTLGTVAVYGFFALSGMLITQSAQRVGLWRFLWHRALRILPGFWVCLLITALVITPLAAWNQHGTLAGYYVTGEGGPFSYIARNWLINVGQWGIHDIFADTPLGRSDNSSVIAGPQWSLIYEVLGYIALGLMGALGILRGAKRTVVALTFVLYAVLLADAYRFARFGASARELIIRLPLAGNISLHQVVCLGFVFLLGSSFHLYRHRLPIHGGLAVVSALILTVSIFWGSMFTGFLILGLPALAYLLVWLAFRLPQTLQRVGSKSDFSYGIYIYGFALTQLLASFSVMELSFPVFVALSLAVSVAAGLLSWHLVEKWALRLKGVLGSKQGDGKRRHHDGDHAVDDKPRLGARQQWAEPVGAEA